MKQYVIFVLFGGLFLSIMACNSKVASKPAEEQLVVEEPSVSNDSLLAQTTREILTLFKNKQYDKIGRYVHPEKGVRFSPYCYIIPEEDVVLDRTAFQDWVKKNDPKKPIVWGTYDPSVEPIKMSFGEYVEQFVYDVDFLNAESTTINESKGFSNTIDNREEVYNNKPFTCSYFSGFDPQYEGMDWRSLHLVYEIEDGKAWLIGIIHSEWTI